MTWTPPSVEEFLTYYPEFKTWDQATVNVWLNQAVLEVSYGSWEDRDRSHAAMALAAHLLVTTPGAAPAEDAGDGGGGSGGESSSSGTFAIKSRTVGQVRVEYDTGKTTQSKWTGGASIGTIDPDSVFAGLKMTPYGRRYLYLMRRNFPAVRVV
jgi:Protein of unknown function (DUF4054)